ncbi:MAG: M13 family metallopeptidase [Burkholderiales bacterium]
MTRSNRRGAVRAFPLAAVAAALALAYGCATPPAADPPAPAAAPPKDFAHNFGFPLGFSPTKMDPAADPRQDFRRYAGGKWLDAATIPGDKLEVSGYLVMQDAVEKQLQALLQEAARSSGAKGTPAQQVGDFYASGMDVARLTALGVQPIAPDMERIAATQGPTALAQTLARLSLATGDAVVLMATVSPHPADRARMTVFVGEGGLGLPVANYLDPNGQKIRDGYLKKVTDQLVIAGATPEAAQATARSVLAIETRIAQKKLTPLELRDPAKRFVPMPYAELKKLLSNVDLDAYFTALGLPVGGEVVVIEAAALRERNAMLGEMPIGETRAYLRYEFLRRMTPYLTPAFDGPDAAFSVVLYGKDVTPPRAKQVADAVPGLLGHPLSQLYVAKYMSPQTRSEVEAMVARVKAEFRTRIERNGWLSEDTRRQALGKLDKTVIRVGYPTQWIDYAGVDIRRDDYAGNAMRINEFIARRELAKLGKPVVLDQFAIPKNTLPIDINAAYNSGWNGIEIPAAFLQPPFYDAKADPAVNFCTMGAVIGHELTHGFDSSGRLYDATGNVRDWWTPDDAKRFLTEAEKLARQASAYEILPGLFLNGPVEVTENLADVGGVSLGYAALQAHLRDHPEANRSVDGFTPSQRCFLAWAQLWADKMNEGVMRQLLPVDGHPPGVYRMAAPAQHEKGFYEAFGIRPGDRMWLDPQQRVTIW